MSKETVVGGNGGVLNEANKMPVQEQKSLENNEGMYYVYFLVIKVLLIFYNLLTDRHVLHTYKEVTVRKKCKLKFSSSSLNKKRTFSQFKFTPYSKEN